MTTISIPISLKENHGINRQHSPVRIGIPFAKEKLTNLEQLELVDDKGKHIPFQAKVTANWHDDSIRWCLLDFFVDVDAYQSATYHLSINDKASQTENLSFPRRRESQETALEVSETENCLRVDTGKATFHINKETLKPFDAVEINGKPIAGIDTQLTLAGKDNQHYTPVIEHIHSLPSIKQDPEDSSKNSLPLLRGRLGGGIRLDLEITGKFIDNDNNPFANFTSTLTFYKNSAACQWEFCIHNPRAAKHPGGFWDLGDPGSIYFKDLSAIISLNDIQSFKYQETINADWQSSESNHWLLHQNSSGGENWQSSNHVNAKGEIPIRFQGYEITEGDNTQKGLRASPTIQIGNDNQKLSAHIKQFWQNFPKSISRNDNSIRLSLFPQEHNDLYELQGGEQKTHTLYLDFGDEENRTTDLANPLQTIIPLQYYAQVQAMPWLPEKHIKTPIDEIIEAGINGDKNFFWKREHADEYGWRHFGDLWADHETLEHGNDDSLKSHYNNQYDPIYGFIRQYILTGDYRWFELADDLARHVIDIDIYHTDEDRLEYNHGMFWHTDHYLDAGTCTHRTFSKEHMKIEHVEQSGGGPGSEHCYTMGLTLYHLMTGYQPARTTVFHLAQWAEYANEGTGGVLERLLQIVKKDIPTLKRIRTGERVFRYALPLSRGTGNYIHTLLDAYLLSNDALILADIGRIIRDTLSPNDKFEDRHFEDIEGTWYYTVLLQSLMTFLITKEHSEQIDEDYAYAKASFMHYANWMLEHEKTYFENREVLVYENDTWAAQEMRKAGILAFAAKYETGNTVDYQEKSKVFTDYIETALKNSKEKYFTRLCVLLMQSQGQNQRDTRLFQYTVDSNQLDINSSPYLTSGKLMVRIPSELLKRAISLSPKNEINWLKNRMN